MRFAFLFSLLLVVAASPQSAKDKEAMGESRKLKILIAGKLKDERTARFGALLGRHFAKVEAIELTALTEKTAAPFDVIIADWERRNAHGGYQDKRPKYSLPRGFSKPIILVGVIGGEIQRQSKITWGGHDLQNEAHGVKKDHPIFKGPLEPKMEFATIDTPQGYKEKIDGRDLPAQMETWKVQAGRVPKDVDNGLVASPYGFEDSPDAEILAAGAGCDNPRGIAMARHGNFFLWGFSGDPLQMTEAARRVFVNAVVWMKKFDGRKPLVTPQASPREMIWHYIEYLRNADGDEELAWAKRRFPDDVREKTRTDPDKLEAYYKECYERMCPAGGESGGFRADADLEELGKVSNRKMDFWDAILARYAKNDKDELAAKLVARYLPGKTMDAAELKTWVEENKKYLFFSDVGGFKWVVDEYAKKDEAK